MLKKIILMIILIAIPITIFIGISKANANDTYVNISLEDFDKIIKNGENANIYIYSDSCSVCMQMKDRIKNIMKKDVNVLSLNISDKDNKDEDFLINYDIASTPTYLKIRNGKIEDRTNSLKSVDDLLKFWR